jgi:hypothetical protein
MRRAVACNASTQINNQYFRALIISSEGREFL